MKMAPPKGVSFRPYLQTMREIKHSEQLQVVAKRIKIRRMYMGMSQAKLAMLTGITQGQVSRYEGGKSSPTAESIISMAHILGTSTDWLLGQADEEDVSKINLESLTEQELKILHYFRSTSPSLRESVVETVRQMSTDSG